MILRNINFGGALGASGVTGYYSGEEYKYHELYKKFIPGFSFENMAEVAKTFTFGAHEGNTKLAADNYSVAEWFPDSIKAFPFHGAFLNAVGLSNPGAKFLIEKNKWQQLTKPFMLSFMAIGRSREERLEETRQFVNLLLLHKKDFKAPFALQMNFSCPNVDHHQIELLLEVSDALDIAGELDIPIVPKFNLLISADEAKDISSHQFCDAICVSNTIPYGTLPEKINWKKIVGAKSPLAKYNGGGLSGKPLFPILCDWLKEVDDIGIHKPILACGGIMSVGDVVTVSDFDYVTGISIGSVAIRYPWRVQSMIRMANHLLKNY